MSYATQGIKTRDFVFGRGKRALFTIRLVWRRDIAEMQKALRWWLHRTRKRSLDCRGMFVKNLDDPKVCAIFVSGTGHRLVQVVAHELQHCVELMIPGEYRGELRATTMGLLLEDMLRYLASRKNSGLTTMWRSPRIRADVRKPRRK